MSTTSHAESKIHVNKVKSDDFTTSGSKALLILANALKLNLHFQYSKATLRLLNFIALFAIITPLVFCILFFVIGVNLDFYPFIVLFTTGAVCHYLLQKERSLIAAILVLSGFLLTNTMLLWSSLQILSTSYLFLLFPFISAILIYPKKQLHQFFVFTSLSLFLFTDAVALFSNLLFSNPLYSVILFKMVMASALCTFIFVVSNNIAEHLCENEINKQQLKSEITSQKAAINNFSGIAVHDLKEPLQTLSAYTGLLKKSVNNKISLADSENHFFVSIDEAIKRMLSLLNDLSTFSVSKVTSEAKVKVDLNVVVQAVKQNLLFSIANASARVRVDELPTVNANFNPMIQLFQNIISNSIKYQPKPAEQHLPIISISAKANSTHNIIYISDNGIGIAENKISCIFEPLKRLHAKSDYEGTGLGLSICKSIVEKYNGKIEVESKVGVGTTFAIYLPIEK